MALLNRRLVAYGTAEEVFRSEHLAEAFGGQALLVNGTLVVDQCCGHEEEMRRRGMAPRTLLVTMTNAVGRGVDTVFAWLTEPFLQPFMQRALVASLVVVLSAPWWAVMSCYAGWRFGRRPRPRHPPRGGGGISSAWEPTRGRPDRRCGRSAGYRLRVAHGEPAPSRRIRPSASSSLQHCLWACC